MLTNDNQGFDSFIIRYETIEERLFKYYARYCNRKYSMSKFFTILAILIATQLTSTEIRTAKKLLYLY